MIFFIIYLDLSPNLGHSCSPMGRGRKQRNQKMKNRKKQAKKKEASQRRSESVRKSRVI